MAHLFDQPDNNYTVTWQPEPDVRGTFSIFSTCTVTILLGIWSVIQLNLPRVGWEEDIERFLLWFLASLFVPESSIVLAWSQRNAANRVQKTIDRVFNKYVETSVSGARARMCSKFDELERQRRSPESNPQAQMDYHPQLLGYIWWHSTRCQRIRTNISRRPSPDPY
jgi:hypothetical protein